MCSFVVDFSFESVCDLMGRCYDLDGLALNFLFGVIVVIVLFRSWFFVVIIYGEL